MPDQGLIPEGGTVAPVILASDKTQLSMFSGDKAAYPLYISTANICKGVRRQPSKHGMLLSGYLVDDKLSHIVNDEARSLAIKRLFHDSLALIIKPLEEAGRNGVMTTCADGLIRNVFPIVASYICDHPEQCLVACIKHSHCPVCEVPTSKRGSFSDHPYRKRDKTLSAINAKMDNNRCGAGYQDFANLGLRVIQPFWANLPHIDVDTLFTPDILHQLHKGMLQTHLLSWITDLMSPQELDSRFRSLSLYPGLRHFGKGVTHITQMTGKEQKEIEKVLMVVIAGSQSIPPAARTAASALLNFIYLSHYPTHTKDTLQQMEVCLRLFHDHKQIFRNLELCAEFNAIPKLHSMIHYTAAIRSKGAADGYSTEGPERLHIDFAKKGYRASNKNEYIKQMIKWLERQEAMNLQRSYLAWCRGYRSYIDTYNLKPGEWDLDDLDEAIDGLSLGDESGSQEELSNLGDSDTPIIPIVPFALAKLPLITDPSNPLNGHLVNHRLAKRLAYRNVSPREVEARHGLNSKDWVWYLMEHLETACPAAYQITNPIHGVPVDIWLGFWMSMPVVRDVSPALKWQKVHAAPASERRERGRIRTVPAHYGTVFALWNPAGEGLQRMYCFLTVDYPE
jgi:hypothetical protein